MTIDSRYRQMGFTRGYSLGEEAGWRDGYAYGIRKGAQIAAEIGFYQGFIHAWITILEKDESSKQRKLTALKTLLEMTRSFPKKNNQEEDTVQRLTRIRVKFKQVNSLLNAGDGSSSVSFAESSYNQSFERSDHGYYSGSGRRSPGGMGSGGHHQQHQQRTSCNEMSF